MSEAQQSAGSDANPMSLHLARLQACATMLATRQFDNATWQRGIDSCWELLDFMSDLRDDCGVNR